MIKKVFQLILFLLISGLTINGQTKKDYFKMAVEAFNNNEIETADSLFSKALPDKPLLDKTGKETYFNKALCRLILMDTCSSCKYFKIAGEFYNDNEALNIYNNLCLIYRDTLYFDNKFNRIDNKDLFKYYEDLKLEKCNSVIKGSVHKKNHKSTTMRTNDILNPKKVDIVAQYVIVDSIKYFEFVFSSSFYKINQILLEDFEVKLKQNLNSRYDFNSIKNSDRFFIVLLYVDKEGKIKDIEITLSPFDKFNEVTKQNIEDDIVFSLRSLSGLKPIIFNEEKVNCIYSMYLGI